MKASRQTYKRKRVRWGVVLLTLCFGCEEKVESQEAQKPTPAQVKPSASPQVEVAASSPSPPPWADRISADGGFPCDVDQVLATSCRRCHFDPRENDAPFSLVKYEDIEKVRSGKPISKLMAQMVEADLMPPLDEPVQPKVTPLTPEQKETLLKWLGAGAPRNESKCP
jgi:hypothetical protein